MTVGILTLDLLLSGCGDLKAKRQVLSGLKTRLRDNFNISISEVGHQDKWQRSLLAIACVGTDKKFINSLLDKLLDFISSHSQVTISDYKLEML